MSELTMCNYCSLKSIRRRYKGKKIKLKKEDGGISVYINDKFVAWFMSLSDSCRC